MCTATVLHTSLQSQQMQENAICWSEDLVGVGAQEAVSTGPVAVAEYASQVLAVMCEAAEHQGGVTNLGKCLSCGIACVHLPLLPDLGCSLPSGAWPVQSLPHKPFHRSQYKPEDIAITAIAPVHAWLEPHPD